MYTSSTTLFFIVAVTLTSIAESLLAPPSSRVVTVVSNMPYTKQKRTREIFENIYSQFLPDQHCEEFAKAYAQLAHPSEVPSACIKIAGMARDGFYTVLKGFQFIHLYLGEDDVSIVMGGPPFDI